MKSRIQKLMAEADVASRRAAEELIEQGRVRVNGAVAKLGDKADPETDVIEVDGERLNFTAHNKVYFALYKPKNVLTTSVVHRGDERLTVLDLVPYRGHLFTIGRLDADSEGLVVLTNDGDLTHKLTHPRYRHTKTYKVTVKGLPSEATLNRWQDGVWLEDEGRTAPCIVSIVKGGTQASILRITMTEGKKRQIRRVALALGHPVERLVRTHIGMLSIEGLRPGEWRELTPKDVRALSTPSPVLKELSTRRRQRRDERKSEPRVEYRDFDSRPRQRTLVDTTPADEERPRRPRYRHDEETTNDTRSKAPAYRGQRSSSDSSRPKSSRRSSDSRGRKRRDDSKSSDTRRNQRSKRGRDER